MQPSMTSERPAAFDDRRSCDEAAVGMGSRFDANRI
jgi:hypothetical protein